MCAAHLHRVVLLTRTLTSDDRGVASPFPSVAETIVCCSRAELGQETHQDPESGMYNYAAFQLPILDCCKSTSGSYMPTVTRTLHVARTPPRSSPEVRSAHVLIAQQLIYRADNHAPLQKVCCKCRYPPYLHNFSNLAGLVAV